MIGAGQLARMTHQATIGLGIDLRVLAAKADDSAAVVAPGSSVGDWHDLDDLDRFADGCDVVTFDHELVHPDHLAALEERGHTCLLYTSPSPRDQRGSRMPSSA